MSFTYTNSKQTAKRARVLGALIADEGDKLGSPGNIEVFTEHQHLFYTMFGWWRFINRSARAFWQLTDEGDFSVEAAPLVRNILDHTYSMMWLHEAGQEGLVAMGAAMQASRTKMINNLKNAGWKAVEELDFDALPVSDAPIEGDTNYPQHKKLVDEFTTFEKLLAAHGQESQYPVYRYLSNYSHATTHTAEAYLEEQVGGEVWLRDTAKHAGYADVISTTVLLIQAGHIISMMIKSDPLRRVLEKAANDLAGLSPELLHFPRKVREPKRRGKNKGTS
ncbi:DUF5677 domain-containing protein [Streptosporangium sp. G12]